MCIYNGYNTYSIVFDLTYDIKQLLISSATFPVRSTYPNAECNLWHTFIVIRSVVKYAGNRSVADFLYVQWKKTLKTFDRQIIAVL